MVASFPAFQGEGGNGALLRIDSWRMPGAGLGPGRNVSEVFIDTDRAAPPPPSWTLDSAEETAGFIDLDAFLPVSASDARGDDEPSQARLRRATAGAALPALPANPLAKQ